MSEKLEKSKENRQVSIKQKALGASIFVLFLALAVYFLRSKLVNISTATPQSEEDIRPLVETAKIRLTDVKKTLRFVGNIKPNEHVILKSEVDAVIKNIYFFEGQAVQAGDLLIAFDDAAALAQSEEVVAKYMNAKAEYQMTKKLAKNKYISESELNKKEAEMKAFYAQIKQAKNTLEKHKVYAPFNGKVGLKEISIGEFMNRGRELVTMVDETPLKVDFKVPEMLIHKIRVGQYVTVSVDGVTTTFSAVIRAMDPVGDKASHSFIVRAILDEGVDSETYGVYPGQFARISLVNDDAQKGILVPESALVRSGDMESVYRVLDGAAIQTEVIVGDNYDGQVEIIGGISDGDVVIINGQERLRDGIRVRTADEAQSVPQTPMVQPEESQEGQAAQEAQAQGTQGNSEGNATEEENKEVQDLANNEGQGEAQG